MKPKMSKAEIDWCFFGLSYYRRYYTGRFFRFFVEKWALHLSIGWNPYNDSRMLYIFIGLPHNTYSDFKLRHVIKRNPDKMLRLLKKTEEINNGV